MINFVGSIPLYGPLNLRVAFWLTVFPMHLINSRDNRYIINLTFSVHAASLQIFFPKKKNLLHNLQYGLTSNLVSNKVRTWTSMMKSKKFHPYFHCCTATKIPPENQMLKLHDHTTSISLSTTWYKENVVNFLNNTSSYM